jgi:hypothetical protein
MGGYRQWEGLVEYMDLVAILKRCRVRKLYPKPSVPGFRVAVDNEDLRR